MYKIRFQDPFRDVFRDEFIKNVPSGFSELFKTTITEENYALLDSNFFFFFAI